MNMMTSRSKVSVSLGIDGAECPGGAIVARRMDQLVRAHSTSVGGLLRRLGVASADVDDVKQCVWLTALRWHARLRPGHERAFLFAVARREAGHTRRSYRRRRTLGDVELESIQSIEPLADELASRRQQVEHARLVLDDMDEELRWLFVALESGEASASQAAKALGIRLGTAKSRLRRARARLGRLRRSHAAAAP